MIMLANFFLVNIHWELTVFQALSTIGCFMYYKQQLQKLGIIS